MIGARRRLHGVLALVIGLYPALATAQLRPYEPFDWDLVDRAATISASLGAGVLHGQRAALAGTTGRLYELGALQLQARTGAVVLEAAGTGYRILHESESFGSPHALAEVRPLGSRRDVGDFRVSTTILLTTLARPATAIVRFGTRLPTTDDRVGLERDRTDFFALVGGRLDHGPLRATAEAGLGIHGTHNPEFEQADVFIYLFTIGSSSTGIRPSILLLGHANGLDGWRIRGNEDLSEFRARLRVGTTRWLQTEAVRGLTTYSPDFGVNLSVGATF